MKKAAIIVGVLAALLLVAYICLDLFLGSVVKAGVNRFAPKLTQTKVELGEANISPFSGKGTLSGLVVGNPKGWSDNNLCSLGKIHLDVVPFSVLGDHIVINEIAIDAPEFNYETKIISSNVADLLKNIESVMGGGKAGTPQATTASGKPIKFEVKKFRMTNGKVRLGGLGLAAMTLPMPPVELSDLGTAEGGITPDQLAFAVMKSVTGSVVIATAHAATEIGKTGGAATVEGAKQAIQGIKGLFGGKK